MRAVFFSDAHLRGVDDKGCALLLSFLRDASRNLDHLFIVGDLFDFWFSRGGVVYPGYEPVIEELAAMQGKSVKIHLFEGNHDFYLAHYFTRYHGIEVFSDEALLQFDGKQIYIAHGDLVDESDRGYRMLRRILRSRLFFGLQRLLPLPLMWRLARLSSDASKEYLELRRRATLLRLTDRLMATAGSYIRVPRSETARRCSRCPRPISVCHPTWM